MRRSDFEVLLQENDDSDSFKQDASFSRVSGLAGKGESFVPVSAPGYYSWVIVGSN